MPGPITMLAVRRAIEREQQGKGFDWPFVCAFAGVWALIATVGIVIAWRCS